MVPSTDSGTALLSAHSRISRRRSPSLFPPGAACPANATRRTGRKSSSSSRNDKPAAPHPAKAPITPILIELSGG